MIGLILRDKMEWDKHTPFVIEKIKIEAEGLVKSYEILRYNKIQTTLILVSQSILKQWIEEIKKSNLTYIAIITKQDLTELQAEDYDIVLVIPSMYNKLITVFSAPNYCGNCGNDGAVMKITENLVCSFIIIKPTNT